MDLWEQLDGSEREAALLAFDGLGPPRSPRSLEGMDVVAELERLEGWEW